MLSLLFRDGNLYAATMRHIEETWEHHPGTHLRDSDDRYWRLESRLFDADVDVDPLEEKMMARRKYRLRRPIAEMESETRIVDGEWLNRMRVEEVDREKAEETWRDKIDSFG